MIIPWTIGQEYADETAALTAVTSCGMMAVMQYGVARLVNGHSRFADDRVPIVIEQVGDYISELQKLNAAFGLYFLVQTPDLSRQRATEYLATVVVQAIETPAINRNKRGNYVTALRACEMVVAVIDGHTPAAGWSPLRVTQILKVQSDVMTVSYAVTAQVRTILAVEAKAPQLLT